MHGERAESSVYDCASCGEVSARLKELASKASVGGTLPWFQIPPSPPIFPFLTYFLLLVVFFSSKLVSINLVAPKVSPEGGHRREYGDRVKIVGAATHARPET